MEDSHIEIRQMIRDRISELGLSITEVANRAQIHRVTLSNILTGKHKPDSETLSRIALALGMDNVKLFGAYIIPPEVAKNFATFVAGRKSAQSPTQSAMAQVIAEQQKEIDTLKSKLEATRKRVKESTERELNEAKHKPTQSFEHQAIDPRDAEIESLKAEVARLRAFAVAFENAEPYQQELALEILSADPDDAQAAVDVNQKKGRAARRES